MARSSATCFFLTITLSLVQQGCALPGHVASLAGATERTTREFARLNERVPGTVEAVNRATAAAEGLGEGLRTMPGLAQSLGELQGSVAGAVERINVLDSEMRHTREDLRALSGSVDRLHPTLASMERLAGPIDRLGHDLQAMRSLTDTLARLDARLARLELVVTRAERLGADAMRCARAAGIPAVLLASIVAVFLARHEGPRRHRPRPAWRRRAWRAPGRG